MVCFRSIRVERDMSPRLFGSKTERRIPARHPVKDFPAPNPPTYHRYLNTGEYRIFMRNCSCFGVSVILSMSQSVSSFFILFLVVVVEKVFWLSSCGITLRDSLALELLSLVHIWIWYTVRVFPGSDIAYCPSCSSVPCGDSWEYLSRSLASFWIVSRILSP